MLNSEIVDQINNSKNREVFIMTKRKFTNRDLIEISKRSDHEELQETTFGLAIKKRKKRFV